MATTTPKQLDPANAKRQINLIRGWPAPHTLPAEHLRTAADRMLTEPDVFVPGLQYAPDPGFQPLREELARFMAPYYYHSRGRTPDPARICITGGASQNLGCVLSSFTDPGFTKAVWVVAPCYHLSNPIFEDAGFRGRLRAVPEDDEGIDLEWLERGLKEFGSDDPSEPVFKNLAPSRKAYRHVIYCVPTSANPSGKTMSVARREGLVRLAREYDALVISDDVYDFLQWPLGQQRQGSPQQQYIPPLTPPPRLVDIDRDLTDSLGASRFDSGGFGHTVSNGSFSKIIAPGVRTGWAEGTPAFALGLATTGSNKSGGAASQLAAVMIWEMIRTGALAAHIDGTVRPDLQKRHALLLNAVRQHLSPLGVTFEEPKSTYGGYFVWLTLPDSGPSASIVASRALQDENLILAAGSMFQVKGDEDAVRFPRNLRLCFSWENEDTIVEGVERLAGLLKRLQDEPPVEEKDQDEQKSFGFV
ncbi:aminotransferase [Pyricularia oryzae Y34]|nr:aminotransferase [Pyricularia oryzae Y34]